MRKAEKGFLALTCITLAALIGHVCWTIVAKRRKSRLFARQYGVDIDGENATADQVALSEMPAGSHYHR